MPGALKERMGGKVRDDKGGTEGGKEGVGMHITNIRKTHTHVQVHTRAHVHTRPHLYTHTHRYLS